jgi:hypothetical protein
MACDCRFDNRHQRQRLQPVIHSALFDFRESQYLIYQPRQTFTLACDGFQILALLLRIRDASQRQGLGEHLNAGERRAQLMRHVRHKLRAQIGQLGLAPVILPDHVAAE